MVVSLNSRLESNKEGKTPESCKLSTPSAAAAIQNSERCLLPAQFDYALRKKGVEKMIVIVSAPSSLLLSSLELSDTTIYEP